MNQWHLKLLNINGYWFICYYESIYYNYKWITICVQVSTDSINRQFIFRMYKQIEWIKDEIILSTIAINQSVTTLGELQMDTINQ